MASATTEITIPAEPEKVWAVVRDFHALADWMPGIESSRSEGDDRILGMMGMEVREHLIALDDAGRTISYGITDGVPVEQHRATITVHDDGDGSRVTWEVDVEPDAMADVMKGIYAQSLEALRSHVTG